VKLKEVNHVLSLSIVEQIAILIISFIVGLLLFYVLSALNKEKKKLLIEHVLSYVVNFIIYMWLGKIITNIAGFIRDPFAILAYPSDSKAFYVATLFIVINIFIKERHKSSVTSLIAAFLPVFLFTSFTFELIQVLYLNKSTHFVYLLFLACLVVSYLLFAEKLRKVASYLFFAVWSIGQFVLSIVQPFTTVFNYMLATSFFLLTSIGFMTLYIYYKDRC